MTENRRLKSKPHANLLGNAAMIIGFMVWVAFIRVKCRPR